MEVGAINSILGAVAGRAGLDGLVLDRARRAAAMLRPTDAAGLQAAALKNLIAALRHAARVDDATATAEIRSLEARLAGLAASERGGHAAARPATAETVPWARNVAAARTRARGEGKLVMVDFSTESCVWCKRLDADVFPRPDVVAALRAFVPVRVDADDGEGRPLAERYKAHIRGYPAILFLDPTIDDPADDRIVGKIPGYMPPASFAEQLRTIASLPRDLGRLAKMARPDDGDAMRLLATALAMQGQIDEAVALIGRAWGPGADPRFDRWAAVYSTIGDESMIRIKLGEAADWYDRAARAAKRPVDVYNAHLGAGFVAMLRRQGATAARELEAAARVDALTAAERDFARELLTDLAQPRGGAAAVPEAAAALNRIDRKTPGQE